ncbi:MAG: hypothetical protein N4A33_06335 [Bacteriovoracaceae bacterium]|jgi:hypothetical protein|nr:hypothetical protein [Bacteriovoracaceae bacterium]
MSEISKKKQASKTIIKKCHCCGQILESSVEMSKCVSCGKSFLPLSYFDKIHGNEKYKFSELFSPSDEIYEEDLIKGLYVLW